RNGIVEPIPLFKSESEPMPSGLQGNPVVRKFDRRSKNNDDDVGSLSSHAPGCKALLKSQHCGLACYRWLDIHRPSRAIPGAPRLRSGELGSDHPQKSDCGCHRTTCISLTHLTLTTETK